MIKINKLDKKNIGLAFSCTNDNNLWGSEIHQRVNKFIMENLFDNFSAYAITYDNKPAGHLITLNTLSKFSPIYSQNSVFLYCLYIAQKFREQNLANTLLNYVEENIKNDMKDAIFVQTFVNEIMNDKLFTSNNYTKIDTNSNDSIFMKKFRDNVDFSLNNDYYQIPSAKNTLLINYNPICPIVQEQYKKVVIYIKENLPDITIQENYINNEQDLKKYGYFGIYFNNIPLLFNIDKLDELKDMLISLKIN